MRQRTSTEGRPTDDTALVARACDGDLDAFGALVERYTDVAFRTALAITRSPADAEEVMQDAFVAAHDALGRFRRGAPLRPWLLRIVANAARNRRRATSRREALTHTVAWAVGSEDAAPSPESAAVAAEERGALLRAVDRLRDDDRLVVVSRFLLELDVSETAAVLGIREGTVKSRLHRALQRLRDALEAEQP